VSDDVTYGALAVPSRRRLLEALQAADHPLDLAALAAASGLHPNTIRFHLDVLVRAGLVQEHRQRRASRGRPRMVYTAVTPTRADENREVLAGILVNHLDESGQHSVAEHAGRAWARRIVPGPPPHAGDAVGATASVATLFREMGFDPATAQGQDNRLDLRSCPFRALAQQHPGVVCGLHRGLLREFVAQVSAGTVDAELVPFVQPHLCVATISTTAEPAAA
jgi:predicted ArsR family transcriptional regulator